MVGRGEPVRVVRSAVVPMTDADVDADQIIPGRYITSRTSDEFAEALFAQRRVDDLEFVLNRPQMRGRSILVAGRNFGCGSSREQAVWALRAGGFRAVIAPSFGDIFASNAVRNGLLVVVLSPSDCDRLRSLGDEAPDGAARTVRVDLVAQRVSVDDDPFEETFDIDPFYRQLLLDGHDELDYLLGTAADIDRFEAIR